MKKKIITCLKCIGLFLIFSFPIEIAISVFSRLPACMCYEVEFQQKMIEFIGYVIADLIGVILSLKIVSRKSNLSNNKLILPFYLIVLSLTHPALGDLSYFKLFNYSLGPNFDYANYHSEFGRFIINNFEFVNNTTFIFFILTTILVYTLIIFIINKKTKNK